MLCMYIVYSSSVSFDFCIEHKKKHIAIAITTISFYSHLLLIAVGITRLYSFAVCIFFSLVQIVPFFPSSTSTISIILYIYYSTVYSMHRFVSFWIWLKMLKLVNKTSRNSKRKCMVISS